MDGTTARKSNPDAARVDVMMWLGAAPVSLALPSYMTLSLLWDYLFRARSRSVHAKAFPSDCIPIVAATAFLKVVPFLLDPATAPGRNPPWHVTLKCLALVAAFLLGVLSVVCTRQAAAARACRCRRAFASLSGLHGDASTRGCFACTPVIFCPGATVCACFEHARPCVQGHCG